MMFEEVNVPLSLSRPQIIYTTFSSKLTDMHAKACLAVKIKRSSFLKTDQRIAIKLVFKFGDPLAFDSEIRFHGNAI
jgi:hypothetical protein